MTRNDQLLRDIARRIAPDYPEDAKQLRIIAGEHERMAQCLDGIFQDERRKAMLAEPVRGHG